MKITSEMLQKYHLGMCSTEELKAISDWLQDDRFDVNELDFEPPKNLADEIWKKIRLHMVLTSTLADDSTQRSSDN